MTRRATLLAAGRVAFLVAVVGFAWWGLDGRWAEIGDALAETSVAGMAGAVVLVVVGLLGAGNVWLRVLAGYGHRVPVLPGLRMFYVGQLGKYIPGSVWSIGAQAHLAAEYAVPTRTAVAAGLVTLGVHVTTAVVAGSVAAMSGRLEVGVPWWLWLVPVLCGVAGLLPVVVNRLGSWVSGAEPLRLRLVDVVTAAASMAVAWACYVLALRLVVPDAPAGTLVALTGAFTLAFAVGVVIVVAPAGLGAREALFVVLLAPTTGVAVATSVALLSRVMHTIADFGLAGASLAAGRSVRVSPRAKDA